MMSRNERLRNVRFNAQLRLLMSFVRWISIGVLILGVGPALFGIGPDYGAGGREWLVPILAVTVAAALQIGVFFSVRFLRLEE